MEQETTTGTPVESGEVQSIQGVPIDDQGQAISQLDDTDQTPAATEASEAEEQPQANSEPSEDEQLTKFAETKGIVLDSENAKKAAKMAMNAEKLMHNKSSKLSELEKSMLEMSDNSAQQVADATGQNPELIKRLQRMEVKDSIRDFWESNPDAKQYAEEMKDIAMNAGLYGSPEAILKASYAMAVASNSGAIKSQGKREALESLAHKQQAAVPRGNAVTSSMTTATITPQNVYQMVDTHDQKWFEANYDAINKAMR